MRIVMNCRRSDRVSVEELVKVTGIQSVNRMSAQSKFMLAWQAINVPSSPLRDELLSTWGDPTFNSRSRARGDLCATATTSIGQRNFPDTTIRIWNCTPPALRNAPKKSSAKSGCKRLSPSLSYNLH